MMFSMLQYIAPQDFMLRVARNKLHSMIVVGSMGSGKTTWTLSLIARAVEELLARGKDDSEIAVVHSLAAPMRQTLEEIASSLDVEKIRYLYWFSDDAPASRGMHSRRSMSDENIAESQFYVEIRHKLERMGFNGFIFVAHATQVYNMVDITFRRLSKIKAFKDYPDEPGDLRIIGPMLGRTYMRRLAEITYKIWNPGSEEDLVTGLSSAVVRFIKKKKVVQVTKRDIPGTVAYLRVDAIEDAGAEEKPKEEKLYVKSYPAKELIGGRLKIVRYNDRKVYVYVEKRVNGSTKRGKILEVELA